MIEPAGRPGRHLAATQETADPAGGQMSLPCPRPGDGYDISGAIQRIKGMSQIDALLEMDKK